MTIFDIIEKAKEHGFDPTKTNSPLSEKRKGELSDLCKLGKFLEIKTIDELLDIEAFLRQGDGR